MKKIKPIGIDLHIKYLCPHCDCIAWLSLKEAQTDKYIVVCDNCHKSFKVKTVDKISIRYKKITKPENKPQPIVFDTEVKDKAVLSLINYGFTKSEASDLIHDAFDIFQTNDIGTLVKESLKLFGAKNG